MIHLLCICQVEKKCVLIPEDCCPYLVDYITCEQPPQRPSDTEESVRTVAGVGRVYVADAAWGTRANVDHERDAFGRSVGSEKDTPETLSQNGSQQPNEVEETTE